MMLWDIIRDFFVMYVFGGVNSNYEFYDGSIGQIFSLWSPDLNDDFSQGLLSSSMVGFPIGNIFDNGNSAVSYGSYISIGDWLSTTATIITLVALFIGITILIIKLFRFVSNLFLLR